MIGYYPKVIQDISEFQSIVNAEFPEFELLNEGKECVLSDAYLTTMSEERIKLWEKILGISVIEESTLEDRRNTIMARLRGKGKLNTASINAIVKACTGGECKSWITDGTLYIRLSILPEDRKYLLNILIPEIEAKLPAHLNYLIGEAGQFWMEVNDERSNWDEVRLTYGTWENVLYDQEQTQTSNASKLDEGMFDIFYLG